MAAKVLFFPDSFEKKSNSVSNFKAKKRFLATHEPSGVSKSRVLNNIRKNLPQTSNRFLKYKNRIKVSELIRTRKADKNLQKIETFESPDDSFQTKVSPVLAKLLYKISKFYPLCQIIPDNSFPEFGQYCYLFDRNCKRIDKFSGIKEKPEYLFISCRFNLPDLIFPSLDTKVKSDTSTNKSMNYINLYSSIIQTEQGTMNKYLKKTPKGSLTRLKSVNNRKCKTPDISGCEHPFVDIKHIFPCSTGKKIKEGPGGFRKVNLLFEKRKYSNSPTPIKERSQELASRSSFSPPKINQKELIEYEEICVKNKLTKQEFVNIVGHFNHLKEKYGRVWIESVAEMYCVSIKVVFAVNGESTSELDIEQFLKFYIIVILKRAEFEELVKFIKNLWEIENNCESLLLTSPLASKSQNFYEKAYSTINLLKKTGVFQPNPNLTFDTLIISLQDSGVSIYDLRLIVMLLIKSL